MIKKTLLATMLALLVTGLAAQEQANNGFDARKLLNPANASSGTPASLNLQYLDSWLHELAKHAKSYPPSFDSPAQKAQAIRDATTIDGALNALMTAGPADPELLRRAGFVNSMGHNLDIQGAAPKAADYFSRLLRIAPDDAMGNWMFGAFLGSVGKPKDAIPLLQKADALGVVDAAFSLGIAYLMTGEKTKALESFEKYHQAAPNDKSVEQLMAAVKADRVETKHVDQVPQEAMEAFGKQMASFYQAPSQEAFDELQRKADQYWVPMTDANNHADLLMAVAIARISQLHNWPIANTSLGARAKGLVQGTSDTARYVDDDSKVDPTKLDVWWASFFATGDTRYLDNIFQFAGLALPKDNMNRMLVIGAATWSFKSNCKQHPKVAAFARNKLATATLSKSQADFAQECVAFAQASAK